MIDGDYGDFDHDFDPHEGYQSALKAIIPIQRAALATKTIAVKLLLLSPSWELAGGDKKKQNGH